MALGDETTLDAPVTPAPIFAYRALRAALWGEEATPERASTSIISNVREPTKAAKRTQIASTASIQLSPGQKRQPSAFVLSPTKSILRTPGAHTPRRALLKDINVKFKDIRKSLSPEVISKATTFPKQMPDGDEEKENQPQPLLAEKITIDKYTSRDNAQSISSQPSKALEIPMEKMPFLTMSAAHQGVDIRMLDEIDTQTAEPLKAEATPSFDADMFVRNTEIEMKKLIKYGQKMREYARRQDEENNKLRLLVEQVRGENIRLRNELEKVRSKDGGILDRQVYGVMSDPHSKESTRNQATYKPASINKIDTNKNSISTSTSTSTNTSTSRNRSRPEYKLINSSKERDSSKRPIVAAVPEGRLPGDSVGKNNNNKRTHHDLSSTKTTNMLPDTLIHNEFDNHRSTYTAAATGTTAPITQQRQRQETEAEAYPSRAKKQRHNYLDESEALLRKKESAPAPAPTPSTQQPQQHQHHLPLRPLTNGTNSERLVPDRLAAARARVRKRAEMRRVSAESDGLDADENDFRMSNGGKEGKGVREGGEGVDNRTYCGFSGDVGSGNCDDDGNNNNNGSNSRINTSLVDWAHL